MKPFRARAGAVVTAAGLLLMGAGAGTARAGGNTIDESPRGDSSPCVSYARGDVWQRTQPEGDGWRMVDGQIRLVPAVAEIPGQAFVPAVVGVPGVPQVEHTEYRYLREVTGATEVSGWLLEGVKPDVGEGDPWILKRLRVVDDPVSTDPASLTGGVLTVSYTNPELTDSTLTMSLSDPDRRVSTGMLAISTTGTLAYSGSTFPLGSGRELAVVDNHAYNVVIATPAGVVVATLPVTASSGHHKEYQYERTSMVLEMSGWLTEMPEGDGWEQSDSRLVVDQVAVPAVTAVAEIPFIKHVPAVDAYWLLHWTRDKQDCTIESVDDPKLDDPKLDDPKLDDPKLDDPKLDDPKLVFTLCHKTFATYAVETVRLRSTEDAQSILGHSTDPGDIIPAFEFVEEQAGLLDARPNDFLFVNSAGGVGDRAARRGYTYLGKNLNPGTLALLANGCQPPSVVPGSLTTDVPRAAAGQPTDPTAVPPAEAVQEPRRSSAATGPGAVAAAALSTEAVVNVVATDAVQTDTSGQLAGLLAGFVTFLVLGFGLVLRRRPSNG